MARKWIVDNLEVIPDELEEEVIKWGDGVFTPVHYFEDKFGDVIKDALIDNRNVADAIRKVDEYYGRLILK